MSETPGKELSLADRAGGSSSNPGLTIDREKSCGCRITALTRNAHSRLIKSLKHSAFPARSASDLQGHRWLLSLILSLSEQGWSQALQPDYLGGGCQEHVRDR